jgi:phosphoribosylformylglycinamidine synthase PurS subunit
MSRHRFVVHVMPKPGVLDPEGQALSGVLRQDGYAVTSVRMGRRIEVEVEAASWEAARTQVDAMAAQVLANPVLEQFSVERMP